MISQEKFTAAASLAAVSVLAAMWFLKDAIIPAVMTFPARTKERLRLWSLRMRRMQDYVGRHRLELAT